MIQIQKLKIKMQNCGRAPRPVVFIAFSICFVILNFDFCIFNFLSLSLFMFRRTA